MNSGPQVEATGVRLLAVNPEWREKVIGIKMLAMDFDGIHTDGCVYTDQKGVESVRCSRIDGLGLELLRKRTDIKLCVISKEVNPVVSRRCEKLKIPCVQQVDTGEGKVEILRRIMSETNLCAHQVLYMGDDVNDLPVFRFLHEFLTVSGIAVSVPNGRVQVQERADYVTEAFGGNGAIREVCEMLLAARGIEISI